MTDPKAPHQSLLFHARGRKSQQRWIDAHQRREAEKAVWFARPNEAVAADMARLEDLFFNRARWKFASTMADNPHSYTLRRMWERDEDFVWTVQTIRTIATARSSRLLDRTLGGTPVLHLRGAKFWPMSFPINYPNGRWCTILINRKPPHLSGDRR